MAAHLRPRVQTTTNREGRSEPSWPKPAPVKCSGVLGGRPAQQQQPRENEPGGNQQEATHADSDDDEGTHEQAVSDHPSQERASGSEA